MKKYAPDLLASVVVFLVALPLCMGIAIASGVPPALGLLTGIIGGLVVGSFQGSPLQVSGPAAGLAVVVWEIVNRHGVAALGVFVAIAGAFQLAAAIARGGRWFRAVPPSVIHGMLAGIGVLIFASQFHVMVDDKPPGGGLTNLMTIPSAIWKGVTPDDLPHEEAALVGVITIGVLLGWNKFAPKKLHAIPGALVGVFVGTTVANVLRFPIAHVSVPASLFGATNVPPTAMLSLLAKPATWLTGAGVAIVASAETLLCASAVDRMHTGPRTRYDRELLAQGVGNTLCGVLGLLPMTGVIVRSSANVEAGAKTRASAILHGVWLLGLIALAPFVLELIPVSSLAAVLVFTGAKLVQPKTIRELRRYGRSEVATYFLTVTAIVITDLLKGVIFGLVIAVARILHDLAMLELRLEDYPDENRSVLHLSGSATFLRLPDIAEALEGVPATRMLVVHFEHLRYLDHATLELLQSFAKQRRGVGGTIEIDFDDLERKFFRARVKPASPRRRKKNRSAG